MAHMKLAPPRKRPRRVARKVANRYGLAHYRDVAVIFAGLDPARMRILEHVRRYDLGQTWSPRPWPGQLTPDGTARIDEVHITGDTYSGLTCIVTKATPIGDPANRELAMTVSVPSFWVHPTLTAEPVDYTEPSQPRMVLSLEAFAGLHREIMDGATEPAPDTVLLPDAPNARDAAAVIDELNEQHGSPKRSRIVDIEMTVAGARVFRPETVKRIDE